jgi:hypothetical protein
MHRQLLLQLWQQQLLLLLLFKGHALLLVV